MQGSYGLGVGLGAACSAPELQGFHLTLRAVFRVGLQSYAQSRDIAGTEVCLILPALCSWQFSKAIKTGPEQRRRQLCFDLKGGKALPRLSALSWGCGWRPHLSQLDLRPGPSCTSLCQEAGHSPCFELCLECGCRRLVRGGSVVHMKFWDTIRA